MEKIVLVALGGAAGSVLRYVLGVWVARGFGERFPFATLAVNLAGCLAIGVVMAAWGGRTGVRLLLVTGLLGGFTTFSAFGHETLVMLRRGETTLALTNIAVSVIVGLAAVGLGDRIGRAL
jgi:CrcB protein